MGSVVVSPHRAVVGPSQQRKLLVKARLVVASGDAQRDAFGRDQIVEAVGASVLEHFKEWRRKIRVELVAVDRFSRWSSRGVEHENSIEGNVACGDVGPADGSALFGEVVDEHAHVAVVRHAVVGEALRDSREGPRGLIPDVLISHDESGEPFVLELGVAESSVRGRGCERKDGGQEEGDESDTARFRGHGRWIVGLILALSLR